MMLAMVLPLPRISISLATGVECFLAHAGSASMASGLRAGAFPSKVTTPVIDEAAPATPGQIDTATNDAATHDLFPSQRMLGSLVYCLSQPGLPCNDRRCAPPRLWNGPDSTPEPSVFATADRDRRRRRVSLIEVRQLREDRVDRGFGADEHRCVPLRIQARLRISQPPHQIDELLRIV